MQCADVREELGPYAIGALERDTREAIEGHLRDCSACSSEAAAYGEASDALALALPLKRAPAVLRERVMAATGIPRPQAASWRPVRWRRALVVTVAAAIAGLLAWAIVLQLQLNDVRDENRDLVARLDGQASPRMRAHENLIYLLFEEDMAHIELQPMDSNEAAEALYVWSPTDRVGVLLCADMAAAPPGKTYQLWFQVEDEAVDGGTFTPDAAGAGQLVVSRLELPGQPQALIVTLEEAGGAPEPTGAVVLRGTVR